MSQVRQNYSSDAEKGVNDQINMELYAFYTYLSMVSGVYCYSLFRIISAASTTQ